MSKPAVTVRKKTIPGLVPANMVDKFKGKYEPNKEHVYYRNDGNKHIKSKGTLC